MTVDEYAAAEHNRANDNARKVHALAAQVEAAYADRDAALERLGAVGEELRVLRRLHEVATERTVGLAAVLEELAQRCEDSIDARYGTISASWLAGQIASADTDAALREYTATVLESARNRLNGHDPAGEQLQRMADEKRGENG